MFKELLEKRDVIKTQLIDRIRKDRLSMRKAAKAIGISPLSLDRFLSDKESHVTTLMKIEDFIND